MLTGTALLQRAADIRLIVLDVDGVLTDGKIIYDSAGQEIKCFHARDGLGISLGVRNGLQFAVITARQSPIMVRRAAELDIAHLRQGARTKLPVFDELARDLSLSFQQIAYIGDDLPDLPPMKKAGLACCPADAAKEIREISHLVSNHPGGQGAVREILDFILECRRLRLNATSSPPESPDNTTSLRQ